MIFLFNLIFYFKHLKYFSLRLKLKLINLNIVFDSLNIENYFSPQKTLKSYSEYKAL